MTASSILIAWREYQRISPHTQKKNKICWGKSRWYVSQVWSAYPELSFQKPLNKSLKHHFETTSLAMFTYSCKCYVPSGPIESHILPMEWFVKNISDHYEMAHQHLDPTIGLYNLLQYPLVIWMLILQCSTNDVIYQAPSAVCFKFMVGLKVWRFFYPDACSLAGFSSTVISGHSVVNIEFISSYILGLSLTEYNVVFSITNQTIF